MDKNELRLWYFVQLKDIFCFYIISYITISYITSVYRSYGTTRPRWVVTISIAIVVHIAQIVIVQITVVVDIARSEIDVARVHIHKARSQPTNMPYIDLLEFFHAKTYLIILSIFSPNFKYLFPLTIFLS